MEVTITYMISLLKEIQQVNGFVLEVSPGSACRGAWCAVGRGGAGKGPAWEGTA